MQVIDDVTTQRRLARDAHGRVGEVMPPPIPPHLCDPDKPGNVWLRPVNGGREWSVAADQVEYLERRP